MKVLKMIIMYLFLCYIFFLIGFSNPPSGVVLVEGEYDDCFFKTNPMTGIPLAELNAIKLSIRIDNFSQAETRLQYFLEEHFRQLSNIAQQKNGMDVEKIIQVREKIKEVLKEEYPSGSTIHPELK